MQNSKTVLIENNPGRNAQTYGIARELGTEIELIHEPSVGVIGNKGDSNCIPVCIVTTAPINNETIATINKELKPKISTSCIILKK